MLTMILGVYIAIGLMVGLAFVFRGVNRVDAAAADSPVVFRIVILPGCVGLWPVVLWKWKDAGKEVSA
ncbi:MAG: hypothetical protein AAGB26_00515 [Planctomycetota bacterium]